MAVQIFFYRNTHDPVTGEFRKDLDRNELLFVPHTLEPAIGRSFSEIVSWIRSYEEQFGEEPMSIPAILDQLKRGLETTAVRFEEQPSPSGE